MGILSRILGLAEGGDRAQRRGEAPARGPETGLARDADRRRADPRGEVRDDYDPLALANVEAAMEARESPNARAARLKIMEALDDEQQCKEFLGAVRRIMREGDGA